MSISPHEQNLSLVCRPTVRHGPSTDGEPHM
jgi:hypothetical protein